MLAKHTHTHNRAILVEINMCYTWSYTTSENDDLQKLVELQMSAGIMWTNTVNYVA